MPLKQWGGSHTCNLNYSGGRDQEDCSLKPAQANSSQDPIWKKPITKEVLVELFKQPAWQVWGPEIMTPVPSKKKKKTWQSVIAPFCLWAKSPVKPCLCPPHTCTLSCCHFYSFCTKRPQVSGNKSERLLGIDDKTDYCRAGRLLTLKTSIGGGRWREGQRDGDGAGRVDIEMLGNPSHNHRICPSSVLPLTLFRAILWSVYPLPG
jgi:hypothetical protein